MWRWHRRRSRGRSFCVESELSSSTAELIVHSVRKDDVGHGAVANEQDASISSFICWRVAFEHFPPLSQAEPASDSDSDDDDKDGDGDADGKRKRKRKRNNKKKAAEDTPSAAPAPTVSAPASAPAPVKPLDLSPEEVGPDPNADLRLSDQAKQAIQYAQIYIKDKTQWKFNKAKQNWLLRNALSVPPSDYDATLARKKPETAIEGATEDAVEEEESELDSDDDADEKEIWKVMKATMPGKEELEGLDDSGDEDDEEFDYVDSDEDAEAAAEEGEEEDDSEDDGPNVIPGMTFSDESDDEAPAGNTEDAADWEDDLSDTGNVFDEDDDDLLPFTDFGSKKRGAESEDEDEDEEESAGDKKRRKKQNDKKKRKKSMQNLPTFASADDYAHLLGGDDDENM